MNDGISIVIPTYNGGKVFAQCLEKITQQNFSGQIQLVVIDSGSTDETPMLAKKAGAIVKGIDKSLFHHSRTRNEALRWVEFDHVVYMVQDAIPCSNTWLFDLKQALVKGKFYRFSDENDVVAVYIRQIPHDDADFFARCEMDVHSEYLGHYPKIQQIESLKQFHNMSYEAALRSVRLDNVCTIYKKETLIKNPFPEIPFAEDLGWAYNTLLQGNKILYQPQIMIKHSHNRSAEYRLKRAVVETIYCGKIMNRVKHDLSFLRVEDLQYFSEKIHDLSEKIKQEIFNENAAGKFTINHSKRLLEKFRNHHLFRSRKLNAIANAFLKKSIFKAAVMERMAQTAYHRIREKNIHVKALYNVTSKQQLVQIVEQFAASQLGLLYGGVYASHMLKGNLYPELEDFIRPYLEGV